MVADAGLLFDPHPLDRFVGICVHNAFQPYLLVGHKRPQYTHTTQNWFLALPQTFNQLNEDNSVLFIVRGEFTAPGDLIPGVTVTGSGPFHITGPPRARQCLKVSSPRITSASQPDDGTRPGL